MTTKDEILAKLRYKDGNYTPSLPPLEMVEHWMDVIAGELAEKPCEYEIRSRPFIPVTRYHGDDVAAVWCKTHGWDCSNAGKVNP